MAARKEPPKSPKTATRRMPTGKPNSTVSEAVRSAVRTSARSTASGPAQSGGDASITDAATAKLAGTEAVAASFPYNAAKPSEFGDAAMQPAVGQTADPPHPIVA